MSTLTTYTTTYLAERRRRGELTSKTAKSMRWHLDTLDRSFGDRPIERLSTRAIERSLEQIGHLAATTRRGYLSTVRTFCRWLVARDVIAANPCDSIAPIRPPRGNPRAMSRDDMARLAAVLPDDRAKAIVALMVGCGLRCVEVSRLTTSDWDASSRLLDVTGKGGHRRTLPVPDETAEALERYLASDGGAVAGPLIRASRVRSAPLSATTISTYVSRWMGAAGLKSAPWDGRSAHACRHTAASDVLDACGDLRVVQEMLGHQHLSTTAIYLRRANLGQMRTAMEGRRYLDAA